ncbi:serine/threonine protein kinase [Candidatus Uabimicrobium amorphum]|uniref:non-specific serine/threonine protein kinase n=1 Tax=Uabimicrobium amorphum TaxID=2596890 RepID=A0A5S9F273_UABAM|nr:serine/threonine-protein kinase [Candidatus Uabimicrobium amorphum]BBM82951.1 serine/threonine protein kinase [Candidatus Uabimicrobium amorphum]
MLINGRYEIIQKLGSGASSEVFLAKDITSQKPVAVKKITLKDDKEMVLLRLQREYALLSEIRHPNILCAYDHFMEQDSFFMITEYVKGCTLEELIVKYKRSLSFYDRLVVAIQLTRSLEVINALGIVHRDIKPPNIMLDSVHRLVKILDLGTGKKLETPGEENTRVTKAGTVVGTPSYMSPEQIKSEIYDNTDVFSCAITLYQFFSWSEQSPFERKNLLATLNAIANETLPPLHEVVHTTNNEEQQIYLMISDSLAQGLIKDPEQRIDIHSFAEQFEKILEKYNMLRMLASGVHGHTWEPVQALSNQEREKLENLRQKYGGDKGIRRRKASARRGTKTPKVQKAAGTQKVSSARVHNKRLPANITSTQRIAKQKALARKSKQQQDLMYSIFFVAVFAALLWAVFYYVVLDQGPQENKKVTDANTNTNTNTTTSKDAEEKHTYRDSAIEDLLAFAKGHEYRKALQSFENMYRSEEKCAVKSDEPFYKLVMYLCNGDYENALATTAQVLAKDYHGFGLYLSVRTFALSGEVLLGTWYSDIFVGQHGDFYESIKDPAIAISLHQEEAYNKWKKWRGSEKEKELYLQYMIAQILRKQPSKVNWTAVRKHMKNEVFKEICEVLYYAQQLNISYEKRYENLEKIAKKRIMRKRHFPLYMLLMINKNATQQQEILQKMPSYPNFCPVEILTKPSVETSNDIIRQYTSSENSEIIKRSLYCSIVNKRYYDKIDSLIEFFPEWPEGYVLKSGTAPSLRTLSGFVSINLGKLTAKTQQIYTRSVGKLRLKESVVFYWNLRRIKTIHQRMSGVLNSRLSVVINQVDELISILEEAQPKLRKQRSPYFYIEDKNWKKAVRFIRREDSQNRLFYRAVYEVERVHHSSSKKKQEAQDLKILKRAQEFFDRTQTKKSVWRNHGLFLVEYINLMMAFHKKNCMAHFRHPQHKILRNIWFEYIYTRLMNEMAIQQKDSQKFFLQKERGITLAYIQRAKQFKKTLQFEKMRQDLDIAAFLYPLFHYNHPIDRQNIEQFLKNRQK